MDMNDFEYYIACYSGDPEAIEIIAAFKNSSDRDYAVDALRDRDYAPDAKFEKWEAV